MASLLPPDPSRALATELVLPTALTAAAPSRQWQLAEADRLLSGATAARAAEGGFWWLDAAGAPDPAFGRPLWITTRMTHCFALGALLGRAGDAALVDHGLAALAGGFHDAEHGGWFAQLDADGPRPSPKGAYEHAFVVLAASSGTLAGRPGAAELLTEALRVQEQHFWDDDAGAVVEEWDRAWTTCDPYRGANANMHTVEAYLAASDATGDPLWRQRALRIATRMVDRGARAHEWRLPEHFDAHWVEQPQYNADQPAHPFRPYGVTPGHGLEWARLLLHLDASLAADSADGSAADSATGGGAPPPSWLRPAAVGLFDRATGDGWDDEHGGLCYTTDWRGVPVVTQHFHWVICEGIAAAAALHRVTGEQRFADWYGRMWEYAQAVFVDPEVPGWLHEANPDGTPSTLTWTGRPDIYHAVQAILIPMRPLAHHLLGPLDRRPDR